MEKRESGEGDSLLKPKSKPINKPMSDGDNYLVRQRIDLFRQPIAVAGINWESNGPIIFSENGLISCLFDDRRCWAFSLQQTIKTLRT